MAQRGISLRHRELRTRVALEDGAPAAVVAPSVDGGGGGGGDDDDDDDDITDVCFEDGFAVTRGLFSSRPSIAVARGRSESFSEAMLPSTFP